MVRKIRKTEIAEKKELKKNTKKLIKNGNIISYQKRNRVLETKLPYVDKFFTDEQRTKVILLIKDDGNSGLLNEFYQAIKNITDETSDNELKNIAKKITDTIDEFEKNFAPRVITIMHLSFFAMNKVIERYFGFNFYKRNFRKENKNIYSKYSYKMMNDSIITNPIVIDKERKDLFKGPWIKEIENLSKKINNILVKLDRYRETYYPSEKIKNNIKIIKKSCTFGRSNEDLYKENDDEYLIKVFGKDKLSEMIKYYSIPIEERYKYENNFVLDLMFYSTLSSSDYHLKKAINELMFYNSDKNKFILENLVNNEITTYALNFEALISSGDDNFIKNLKLPEIKLAEGNTIINIVFKDLKGSVSA